MPQIQLRDKTDKPITLVNVRIAVGKQNEDKVFAPVEEGGAYDDKFSDLAGNTAWPNPLPSTNGYTLWTNYANVNDNYLSDFRHVDSLDNNVNITLNWPPLQRLFAAGNKFVREDGREFKWIFGSSFMLHQLVAEGINISPGLYDGLNGYRVFGSMHWIPSQIGMKDFDPDNYPNWQQSLGDLADILYERNKYFQYNVLCDRQYLPGDVNKMRNMVSAANEVAVSKKNMICALGNENPKNGFNASDFTKPHGALWCTGSGLGGGPAPLSNGKPWDYQCQHLRRDRKMFIDIPPIDAPTYDLNNILLFDETIGFADFDNTGSRTSNVTWAFQVGAVMRGWYGGVVHLHNGVHSRPLGGRENECKEAFIKGMEG